MRWPRELPTEEVAIIVLMVVVIALVIAVGVVAQLLGATSALWRLVAVVQSPA